MSLVCWAPEAIVDFGRIDRFNLTRSERWADHVRTRIETRCKSLAALPQQGRPVGNGLRLLSIPDIQYVVFYDYGDEEVTVRRIFHTRENREEP